MGAGGALVNRQPSGKEVPSPRQTRANSQTSWTKATWNKLKTCIMGPVDPLPQSLSLELEDFNTTSSPKAPTTSHTSATVHFGSHGGSMRKTFTSKGIDSKPVWNLLYTRFTNLRPDSNAPHGTKFASSKLVQNPRMLALTKAVAQLLFPSTQIAPARNSERRDASNGTDTLQQHLRSTHEPFRTSLLNKCVHGSKPVSSTLCL